MTEERKTVFILNQAPNFKVEELRLASLFLKFEKYANTIISEVIGDVEKLNKVLNDIATNAGKTIVLLDTEISFDKDPVSINEIVQKINGLNRDDIIIILINSVDEARQAGVQYFYTPGMNYVQSSDTAEEIPLADIFSL